MKTLEARVRAKTLQITWEPWRYSNPNAIKLNDIAYDGKQRGRAEEMWRFPEVNFAQVAESFGCAGIRVEKPGDLTAALKRAIAMDRPVVVDVVTDMYAIAPHPWTPGGRDFHSYQKTGA